MEVCAEPLRYLDDWVRLYAGLAARHGLTGIRAFSPAAFRRQLELPGMVAVRAERDGETVGMALWLEDAPNAYYHLAAYSPAGLRGERVVRAVRGRLRPPARARRAL